MNHLHTIRNRVITNSTVHINMCGTACRRRIAWLRTDMAMLSASRVIRRTEHQRAEGCWWWVLGPSMGAGSRCRLAVKGTSSDDIHALPTWRCFIHTQVSRVAPPQLGTLLTLTGMGTHREAANKVAGRVNGASKQFVHLSVAQAPCALFVCLLAGLHHLLRSSLARATSKQPHTACTFMAWVSISWQLAEGLLKAVHSQHRMS
jgi:hypothetical protein